MDNFVNSLIKLLVEKSDKSRVNTSVMRKLVGLQYLFDANDELRARYKRKLEDVTDPDKLKNKLQKRSLEHMNNIENMSMSNEMSDKRNKLNHWLCPICKDPEAEEPCAAKCGHVCCRSCWAQWLQRQTGHKGQCPICKSETSPESIMEIIYKSK